MIQVRTVESQIRQDFEITMSEREKKGIIIANVEHREHTTASLRNS